MSAKTVVVAHREAMVAESIAAALAEFPGIVPISVATTTEQCERSAQRAHAVVLDQSLPGAKRTANRLRSRGVRIVFLQRGDGLPPGDEDGISVSTRSTIAHLASALVPQVTTRGPGCVGLTPREEEVLGLVTRGLTAKQVARQLGLSPKTVENCKARIFGKLGVENQTAAVYFVLRRGVGRMNPWMRSAI